MWKLSKLLLLIYFSSYDLRFNEAQKAIHNAALGTIESYPQTSVCNTREENSPRLIRYNTAKGTAKQWNYRIQLINTVPIKHQEGTTSICHATFQNATLSHHVQSLSNQEMSAHSTTLPVLELIDGTKVMPEDIRNVSHLIELLPLIANVLSEGLIDWLDGMNIDDRQAVLIVLEGQSLIGDVIGDVEQLYHFQKKEQAVARLSTVINAVASGDFFTLLANMNQDEISKSTFTFPIFAKALENYKNRFDNTTENELSGVQDNRGFDFSELNRFLAIFQFEIFFAAANWDSKALDLMLIQMGLDTFFTLSGALGAGMILTQLGFLMAAFTISKNVADIMLNIDNLVNGNLSGMETAIVAISLTINVLAIIGAIAGVFLPSLVGAVILIITLIIGMILELVKQLLIALSNRPNIKKINRILDSLEYDVNITPKERKRQENYLAHYKEMTKDMLDLWQTRLANDALVDYQLDWLRQNSAFDRYVVPSMTLGMWGKLEFHLNSTVDLSFKKRISLDRAAPKLAARATCNPVKFGSYIVCGPKGIGHDEEEYLYGYPCSNAIAVEYFHERDEDPPPSTLIMLMDGCDTAVGMPERNNTFLVGNGIKDFTGGNLNDVFVINGNSTEFQGQLNGGLGNDSIIVTDDVAREYNKSVDINFVSNRAFFGFNGSFILTGIETAIGREGLPDKITAGCTTQAVLGRGGLNIKGYWDTLFIPSQNCSNERSTFIDIIGTTSVESTAEHGNFTYRVSDYPHDVILNIEAFPKTTQHVVILMFGYDEYEWMQVNVNSELIIHSINGTVITTLAPLEGNEGFHSSPLIMSLDNLTSVSVSRLGIVNVMYNMSTPSGNVSALDFGDWTFVVNSTAPLVQGRDGNDSFVVFKDEFQGDIKGGGGINNHLILEDSYHKNENLFADMSSQKIFDSGDKAILEFDNISMITGRSFHPDRIDVACSTLFVNARNSSSVDNPNVVNIPKRDCKYNTNVRLEANSILNNFANNSEFVYIVPMQDNITLNLHFHDNVNHTVLFEFNAKEIINGSFSRNLQSIYVNGNNDKFVEIPIFKKNQLVDNETTYDPFFGPVVLTADQGLLRVSQEGGFQIVFDISNDTESIQGSPFARNIFLLKANLAYGVGGNSEDLFILQGTDFQGTLNGRFGSDILLISDDYNNDTIAVVDMSNRENKNEGIYLEIEGVVGRNNMPDMITAYCDTETIDGRKGTEGDPDVIVFENQNCTFNTKIQIGNYTVIDNTANLGNFLYNVEERMGHFNFITKVPTLNHTIFLNLTQVLIKNVTFDKDLLSLNFEQDDKNLSIRFQNFTEPDQVYYDQPAVLFNPPINTVPADTLKFIVNNASEPVAVFNVFTNKTDGFPFIRNTFVIHSPFALVAGGNYSDTFVFINANETSRIYGNLSQNSLVINGSETSPRVNIVSLPYVDLYGAPENTNVIYSNISMIVGRENQSDTAVIDCNTTMVNLQSGFSTEDVDTVLIPYYDYCNYTERVNILIQKNTSVKSETRFGNFFHVIMNEEDDYHLDSENGVEVSHTFVIQYNTSRITAIRPNYTDPSVCSVSFILENDVVRTYSLNNSMPCWYPYVLTSDLHSIKVGPWTGTAYSSFLDVDELTVEETRDKFQADAVRLNMTITVLSNTTGVMSTFAKNFTEYHLSNPDGDTHLYGAPQNETFYIIQKGRNDSMSKVWIYGHSQASQYIDLTQLMRPVRQHKASLYSGRGEQPPLYLPELKIIGQDLQIFVESSQQSHPAEITLVDYFDWVSNVIITVHQLPMTINETDIGDLGFVPMPIPINTTLQVIDEKTFEDNQEIHVDYPCPTEMVAMYHGNNLVVTNIFSNYTQLKGEDMFIMAFDDFLTNGKRRAETGGYPQGVKIKFNNGLKSGGTDELILDRVIPSELDDLVETLIEEREKLDGKIFGFRCLEEGIFQHPRKCDVYYECTLIGQDEFIRYEFNCPAGTVFCKDANDCSYEVYCPCDI